MIWRINALADLTEDPGSVPGTHMRTHNHLYFRSMWSDAFWPPWAPGTRVLHIHVYMQVNTHVIKINTSLKIIFHWKIVFYELIDTLSTWNYLIAVYRIYIVFWLTHCTKLTCFKHRVFMLFPCMKEGKLCLWKSQSILLFFFSILSVWMFYLNVCVCTI